jgi:hypothetical protein
MNKSRTSNKVRVIRLDGLPARAAGPKARAPDDDPPSGTPSVASQPWPLPIGSGAAQARAALHLVPDAAPGAAAPGQVDDAAQAPMPGEPTLTHLRRGKVKAWPVRVLSEPADFSRLFADQALLVLLSLGLYAPWAASRLRRHQWRHTRVAGRSLDDHESPWSLALHGLIGLVLMGGGMLLSWRASTVVGLLATSMAALVWPQWLFMRLRQRAHHLSWARRRLGFAGRSRDVYRAVWPLLAGGLGLLWAGAAAWHWGQPLLWCAWGLGAATWLMCLPLATWGWLRWRQRQLRLGPWALWWTAPREGLVSVFWRTVVWLSLAGVFTAGLLLMGMGVVRWCGISPGPGVHALLAVPALLWAVAVRAYIQARLQNLVWGKTGNRHVRFQSRLDVSAYVALQCRHALLLLCTAGLYWPWARLGAHRMRMQAITVWSRVEAEQLLAHWPVAKRA